MGSSPNVHAVCAPQASLQVLSPPSSGVLLHAVAGAYAYLERFVAEFDSSHSLALLPNYAFALPMARYRLEQAAQQQQQQAAAGSSGSSSGVGAVSSLTLLAQALLLHPLVLVELVDKLQGQGAAREEAWQQLKKRKLYAKVAPPCCCCCCGCCWCGCWDAKWFHSCMERTHWAGGQPHW